MAAKYSTIGPNHLFMTYYQDLKIIFPEMSKACRSSDWACIFYFSVEILLSFFDILGGILSLLDESQSEVHDFALKKLNNIVDVFWPEISEAIQKM